jgi:outer membrane protein OmpA-like peptidoglycan-associated protein
LSKIRANKMRASTAALLASLAGLGVSAVMAPAGAQVPTGNEVSVNPMASAGTTLLYPGGQYARVVHPLLQPGQKASDSGPLVLHMPSKNAARTPAAPRSAAATPAAPRRAVAVAAPVKPAIVKPAPTPAKKVASAPPASSPFGPPGAASLAAAPAFVPTTPAAKQELAKTEPVPAPAPLSSIEPSAPGLTKRSVILFAAGASDPAQSALGAIKYLAGDLNTAMTTAGARVQLIAYGGDKGDKGSDARRLSLKRALAIRQVLIDDGVPSERIDVRAMGGADDGGPADRVDVYVKA